jgi:hypothetical protein
MLKYYQNKIMNTFIIIIFVNNIYIINGFLINKPVRQIMVTNALTNTIIETVATNVFDQSDIIKNISCNCEDHSYLISYLLGMVCFSFVLLNNNKDAKLQNIEYYKNIKKMLQQFVFILLIVFGKGVESVM